MRTAQCRIVTIQSQGEILVTIFAAIAVGCKERGIVGIDFVCTGNA